MSKNTGISLVNEILLVESSCNKHSKTGTVKKAKRLQTKPCCGCLSTKINGTLFYFQAEESSTSHKMSKLFENEQHIADKEDIFQSYDDEAGKLLQT